MLDGVSYDEGVSESAAEVPEDVPEVLNEMTDEVPPDVPEETPEEPEAIDLTATPPPPDTPRDHTADVSDDQVTIHPGNTPETLPTPETHPESIPNPEKNKPVPPEGWSPGGIEGRF